MKIETPYNLGDIVYYYCDTEKLPYIIIEILIKNSGVEYCLSSGTHNNWNYAFEFDIKK